MIDNKYHSAYNCPYCGGRNDVEVVAIDGGYVSEAHTYCWDCGWSDYFAYGFYEEYMG